jgi:hypothetical protein
LLEKNHGRIDWISPEQTPARRLLSRPDLRLVQLSDSVCPTLTALWSWPQNSSLKLGFAIAKLDTARAARPSGPFKMTQSPMISSPLKATNEIDWITPLKDYIRDTYGDDPERYAEECATLNRLRQDMRGAGKESTSGRDMLYRYYGQLELLDLRFPVDEQHIKISFTWFVPDRTARDLDPC